MIRPCKELKRCARENLTHHYGIPMGALLVAGFIPLAIDLPFSMTIGENPTMIQQVILSIADFLIALIGCILTAGLVYLHLNMARKKPYQVQMVTWGFKNRPDRFILATLLELVLVLPGLLPAAVGIALLYLPSISTEVAIASAIALSLCSVVLCLMIYMNVAFLLYFVIDRPEQTLMECLRLCVKSISGYRLKLFYVYLSFLGLDILCLLSLGIGTLWVYPYQSQTLAAFYLDLTEQTAPANTIDTQI